MDPFTMMLIGSAIGGGVGSMSGNAGKGALIGAGVGLGGGYMMGAGGGAGGVGAAGTGGVGAAAGISPGFAGAGSLSSPAGMSLFGGGIGSSGSVLGGAAAGGGLANALMLGQAGLSLASAFSSQGASFQDKIPLSEEGKKLKSTFADNLQDNLEKRKAGSVTDVAFQDIHNLKTDESKRNRAFQSSVQQMFGTLDNQPRLSRGTAAKGGSTVKTLAQGAGERQQGLFAPYSTLNNYRRETLFNAVKDIQNLYSVENQTASFNYAGKLANWNANQRLAADKGAAIGGVVSMMGNQKLNNAYMNWAMNQG